MADSEDKKKSDFKKTEHRPWKTSLLEMTVQASDAVDQDDLELDIDLDTETSIEPLYSEFNFVEEGKEPQPLSDIPQLDISGITDDLKSEIRQTEQQKDLIKSKLRDPNASPISLGGF